jgi:hypothetical protein
MTNIVETGEQRLIRPLFEGPLDIVGDIHGEIDALSALLGKLGYDETPGDTTADADLFSSVTFAIADQTVLRSSSWSKALSSAAGRNV